MTDSGKHSALRQTDDGSFELVLDREGLQEVSEEEVSFAEVTAPEPLPRTGASSRVLAFSVLGVVALLALTAIGWFALSPGDAADEEPSEVAGFKPYVGGEADDSSKKQSAARRARLAAIAGAEEPAEEVVEEVVEEEFVEEVAEITEDEPGWELSEQAEDGVLVEVEGTDAAADDGGEVAEPTGPSLMSQKRFDALRRGDIGRKIQAPRVPALNGANPLSGKRLPIRNLKPAPMGEDDSEDVVEEEVEEEVEAEEGEEVEEVVEDDEIIEEELH